MTAYTAQQPEIYIGPVGAQRLLTNYVDSWAKLEITDRFPYGTWQISWDMPLKPWQRFSWLKEDALVQVRVGPVSRAWGVLSEPDWDSGAFVAVGLARQGEETICLDATGKTNAVLDTCIDQAIARSAVDWVRPASLSATAFGGTTETERFNYLTALADAWSASQNKRWLVDTERAVRAVSDPTVPSAFVSLDTGVLGVSDRRKAGIVFGRYLDSTSGLVASAQWPSTGGKRPEVGADWTPLGPMTYAAAQALCQSAWSRLQGSSGWTNGIQVQYGQLLTMGDTPKALWNYHAGQVRMYRMLGLRDERNRLLGNTDLILGESIWRAWEGTLQLNPVGLDGEDPGDVITNLGGVKL